MAFATAFIIFTWFIPYYICKTRKKLWQVLFAVMVGIIASIVAAIASTFLLNWINPDIFQPGATLVRLVGFALLSLITAPVAALMGRKTRFRNF